MHLVEVLESRQLLASDWQNPYVPLDVSNDGVVVPLDALLLINEINAPTVSGPGGVLPPLDPGASPPAYLDTTGDGVIAPIDVLQIINAINTDVEPPLVVASLVRDTAPWGETNFDGVTSDAAIHGQVTDLRGISSLKMRLDGASLQPVAVEPDGKFVLNLGLVPGGEDDGEHLVEFQATDGGALTSSFVPLRFVFDTLAPSSARLDLAPTSDGDTLGDHETNAAFVTLVGQSDPNVVVTLAGTQQTSLANAQGYFQFPRLALETGANSFAFQVTDRAGNSAEFSQVVTRSGDLPGEDVVLKWNGIALAAIARDATTPPQAARNLALVSVATYDALMAFQSTQGIYSDLAAPAGASAEAAAAAAAHRVLSTLYPAQVPFLDEALGESLSSIPNGDARTQGTAVGQTAAQQVLAVRAGDGWDQVVEYDSGDGPGDWQPTAPMFDVPLLPQWRYVQPFALNAADQFRPPEPPSLASDAWVAAYEEVREFGAAQGSQRSAEQTQIARFWADGRGTDTPPGHWNRIAAEVARSTGTSTTVNARMLLELNFALADAGISAWDAKYTYGYWRPITAIQAGDTDGNPATQRDLTWEPLLVTPNFPEYTSGHSTFSGAAAAVLTDVFGDDQGFSTTSWSLAGVTRSFASFDAAANEAGQSRIYGGIHYQFSNQAGLASGRSIGGQVADRLSVAKDDQPPSIFLDSLPQEVSLSASPTLTGRVHDLISGVQRLEFQVNGGDFEELAISANGSFTLPTNLPSGSHTVRLRAFDWWGNLSVPHDVYLNIDATSPSIELISPEVSEDLRSGARVSGLVNGTGSPIVSVSYAWDNGQPMPMIFSSAGAFDELLDLSRLAPGDHTLRITTRDAAGNVGTLERDVSLTQATPFQIRDFNPSSGSANVGVTVRPQIVFTRPADPTSLNDTNFFATGPSGQKLPATIVPATDGSFAWLFFRDPMPGGATVTVHVVGEAIRAKLDGATLDADNNGSPGGTLQFRFSTVPLSPVPGTTIVGVVADPGPDLQMGTVDDTRPGPDGKLMTADDLFLNPLAHVRVHVLGLESQTVFTDANGRFELMSLPAGNVKLVVDGMTATNSPSGVYFPEMVMDLYLQPGQPNTVMSAMEPDPVRAGAIVGTGVYLPRLATSILQNVYNAEASQISVRPEAAPNLTAEQQALLTIDVPAGALVGKDGQPAAQGQIGISTVPPELVRDMLPEGVLQHTFDITVQAPGISNFATPAPMTFPNVFNAPPGTKLNFLSFDHNTGRLVIEGTVTVSPDGKFATTDPGTGVTHPGWHGMTPEGGPGCGDSPPDTDQDDDEPPVEDPVEHEPDVEFFTGDVEGGGGTDGEGGPSTSSFPGATGTHTDEVFRFEWYPPQKPDDGQGNQGGGGGGGACPVDNDDDDEDNQEKIVIKITIQGGLEKWMKKGDESRPLKGDEITLYPAKDPEKKKVVFSAKLKPYKEMLDELGGSADFPLKELNENLLYGSEIKLEYTHYNKDGKVDDKHTGYKVLYRFIDATDDKHSDRQMSFEWTAVGASREKPIVYKDMPGSVRPTVTIDPPSAGFSSSGTNVVFQPTDTGYSDATLKFKSPRNPASELTIGLASVALPKTRLVIDTAPFVQAIIDTYNEFPNWMQGAEREALEKVDLATGQRQLDLDRVNLLVQNTVLYVTEKLQPLSETIVVTTGSGGGPHTVLANDFHPDALVDPPAVLATPVVGFFTTGGNTNEDGGDIQADAVRKVTTSSHTWSLAERVFHLSNSINLSDTGRVYTYVRNFFNANLVGGTPPLTFTEMVAAFGKTIAHEFGHTLGLLHTWNNKQQQGFDATDLMRQGILELTGPGAIDEAFNRPTSSAIKIATGGTWDLQVEGQAAVDYYTDSFRFRQGGNGLNTFDDDSPPEEVGPPLNVNDGFLLIAAENGFGSTDSIDFGDVVPSGAGKELRYLLINLGDQPLLVNRLRLQGDRQAFVLNAPTAPFIIPSGESRPFTLRFAPESTGTSRAQLLVDTDGLVAQTQVAIRGRGQSQTPHLTVDLSRNNAGGARTDQPAVEMRDMITLINDGVEPLVITRMAVAEGASEFSLMQVPEDLEHQPLRLAPGESFNIGVKFKPSSLGLRRAAIEIDSNDPEQQTSRFYTVGTGLDRYYHGSWGEDFVAFETPNRPSAPVLRAVSDRAGRFEIFVPSQQEFHLAIFDPQSGLIAHNYAITARSGQRTPLTESMEFRASYDPDRDGDGVPDDIEFAVGIRDDRRDTDDDGLDDFTELQQQLDPVGGRRLPLGVIASTALQGEAKSVVVAGELNDRERQVAYVATGSFGLAVVDASQFTQPVVISEINLPGDNQDVVLDPSRNLAIVAGGDAGVHLIDVSDPTQLTRQRTIALPDGAQHVEVYGRRIFAASGTAVLEVDAITGETLQSLDLGAIGDLAVSGSTLFVLVRTSLQSIDLDQARLTLLDSFELNQPVRDLFVGGGIAYAAGPALPNSAQGGGFSTVDVIDPSNLQLISGPDNVGRAPGYTLAVNGSGLALVGDSNAPTQPGVIQVLDVTDPSQTAVVVTQFVLPGRVNSVAIASGLGYVADDTQGLKVLNYRDFDIQREPPQVALTNLPEDADPATDGLQVYEGSWVPLQVTTTDDFQVRQVELLLNGERVGNDVSFPFEFVLPLPNRTLDRTTATVQIRATDTGGNQATTDLLTWELIPDVTPPSILTSNPAADASAFLIPSILVEWSESLDPAVLSLAGVTLKYLGADGVSGGGDDVPVALDRLDLRNRDRLLTIVPQAPPDEAGLYELEFSASAVSDRAGNHLTSSLMRRFTLRPASDVRALQGTPAIARVPSANAGQIIGFKIPGAHYGMRMTFPIRFDFDGAIGTVDVFPNEVVGDMIYFKVPTNAATGNVQISGDPNGPFPLQIVPALFNAQDGNAGADWIRADRLTLIGTGFQEAATTILLGDLSIVDTEGRYEQLPDAYNQYETSTLELQVPFDAPVAPIVVVTEGGRSNALNRSDRIAEIVSAAASGIPAVADVPAANPGQAITIRGTNLKHDSLVAFPTVNLGGDEFLRFVQPDWVSDDGLEAIVTVPPNAITGDVRVLGDNTNSRARLQVVPVIETIDFHTLQGTFGQSSVAIARFSGRTSIIEDHGTIYRLGSSTVVDDGSAQSPDVIAFYADPFTAHVDVRFPTEGNFSGQITITTAGGTSAPYNVQFTSLESTAYQGTAANPALPSANPGQVVTVRGTNLKSTTDFLGRYTDSNGTPRLQLLNPDFASVDGTYATIVVPAHFNGVETLQLLGSTFTPSLQIVPTIDDVDVNGVNRIQLHGRGFLEGQGSAYQFPGGVITDGSISSDPVDVFHHEVDNGGGNLTLPRSGSGTLTVTTAGGTSAPLNLNLINPQLGALLDLATGSSTFVATSSRIYRLNETSGASEFDFAIPGGSTSQLGLQLLNSVMTLAGTSVPAGSLLVSSGAPNPDRVYAVNPSTGATLATLNVQEESNENLDTVAGVYHAPSGHLFLLDADPNQLLEVDPNSGAVLARYPISLDIGEGGLVVDPASGNLWVSSDRTDRIAEFRSDGQLLREVVLPDVAMSSEATGLAFDATGKLRVSSNRGVIYSIDLAAGPPPSPQLEGIESTAQGGTPANAGLPSANAGQMIVLTGQNFLPSTQVVFPIRDHDGHRSSVVVLPSAVSQDGTSLQVIVPDQAETGDVTIAAFRAPANLGFNSSWGDSIYRDLKVRFTPQEGITHIHFTDGGLQDLGDESWGIDNVRVRQVGTGGDPLFEDSFEGGAKPEWTFSATDRSLAGTLSEFSGRFNNLGQDLALAVTPGQEYELTFDFYALDSWDGTAGPDVFSVLVDGQRLFHEAFSNAPQFLQTFARPDLGSVRLQIVPTLTGVVGNIGGEYLYTLEGSGFMEAGMTVTIGGQAFQDRFADDSLNITGDVNGSLNASFVFGHSLTLAGPLTVTTLGGSSTFVPKPVVPTHFSDLVRIDSVAEAGTPLDPQIPSANIGQDLVIVGRGLRNDTLVHFTGVDDAGGVGTISVQGTADLHGTRLTVRVPTLASTGMLRIEGDPNPLPLQIVPKLRGAGGQAVPGGKVVLDGIGFVAGQTTVTVDGHAALVTNVQTVFGTVGSFLPLQQQLLDITVPAGATRGQIVVTTPGGSYALPLPLAELPPSLPDLTPPNDAPESIGTALAVQLPSGSRVKLSSRIGDGAYDENDVDVYAVNLLAGDRITAVLTTDGESLDFGYVQLFNAQGESLAAARYVNPARIDDFVVPESGTYYFGINGDGSYDPLVTGSGEFGFSTGAYDLQLERLSSPVSHLHSVQHSAAQGTPRVSGVPSANPGETVTLQGIDFKVTDRILFTMPSSQGILIIPTRVSEDGRSMTVEVPQQAQTGTIRLDRDDLGIVLQIVPKIDKVGMPLFSGNSFQIQGYGFNDDKLIIEMDGEDIPDTISGNNLSSYETQVSGAITVDMSLRNLAVRTAGGVSNRVDTSLTEIFGTVELGSADQPGLPSANPGQTIRVKGTGFHAESGIVFTTRDVGGRAGVAVVRPATVVSPNEVTVTVPLNAATGPVWVVGDTSGMELTLQVVPLITRADVTSINDERLVVMLYGHSFYEGHDSPYQFGNYTRYDTNAGNNFQGIEVKNFFDDRYHYADVPLSFAADIFGPISVRVPGGTGVFQETVTEFTSVATSGTAANPALPSANPGQLVTIHGSGLDNEVEILFRYTDSDGRPKWLGVNPTTTSPDRTSASFAVPEPLSGVVEMHILGSTFERTLQIVPLVSDVVVQTANRVRMSGKGFLEGNGSQYNLAGSLVTDSSLTDSTVLVFDTYPGANNSVDVIVPAFGFGNLTVTTLGGTSAPFAMNLISTSLGRLNDVAEGYYVATATTVHRLDPATGQSLSSFPIPGTATTDSVGLQLLKTSIPSLGGVEIPAGSLLLTNGRTDPDKMFAVNPADGSILATLNIGGNLDVVAGVYHAGVNRLFVLDGNPNEVVRLNPETGEIITSFSTPFDVAAGGLAIDPVTGNLWIGSSQTSEIAEVNVTGQLQRRVNLASQGVDGGEITGLAFAPDGKLLVSTVNGFVHRVTLPGAAMRLAESAISGSLANDEASSLSVESLARLQAEAIRTWERAGASEQQLARLSQIRISVADLSGAVLGWTTPDYVMIDLDAGGYGWFVDPTPWSDDEFLDSLSGAAAGKADLLSVLAHEFGHVLYGDEHVTDADEMLYDTIALGVRRLAR